MGRVAWIFQVGPSHKGPYKGEAEKMMEAEGGEEREVKIARC